MEKDVFVESKLVIMKKSQNLVSLKSVTTRVLAIFLITILVFVTGCGNQTPSRFEQAQVESTQGSQRNQAVSKDATSGGSFNKFFPNSDDGYERVYTQEKPGFAEAKLKEDGKEVAMLSISDTISNPSALNKFQNSSDTIDGYPSVQQGSTGTAVLVNDRYQVKVLSRDPSFTESDREEWLEKFDLDGLAKLK